MNSKYFDYVIALAEERNFSAAARRLNISQPLMSQAIHKIEEELGCMIFDRSSTPLRVTPAGQVVVDSFRQICYRQKEMKKALSDMKNAETGTLTIGASPYRSSYIMPGIIRRFREKYPKVEVVLVEEKISELQVMAAGGELDMAISTFPIDENAFEYKKMQSEEIILAVPGEWEINGQLQERGLLSSDENRLFPVMDLKDVAELPFVTLGTHQFLRDYFLELCRKAGFEPFKAVTCTNIASTFAMVTAGVGAAVIPNSMLHHPELSDSIRFYSIAQAESQREIAVMYRKGQYLTAPAEEMLRLLAESDIKKKI